MRQRTGWRALLLRLLPWYDIVAERERDRRTAAMHRRAIAARIASEEVIRDAYREAGARLSR